MGLTQQNLRDELREALGVDEDDMSNTKVDLLLNMSWWEIADKYNFQEKNRESSISTVAGTRDYAAPASIEAIQQLFITPDETGETPVKLKQMGPQVYAEKYIDNEDAEDKPTHYYSWDNDTIRLWPTPDDEYIITVEYAATLEDIVSAGLVVPQSWHEIVLQGAIWRGFRSLKDYQTMMIHKNIHVDMLNGGTIKTAKEKSDNRYAAVSVPINRRRY